MTETMSKVKFSSKVFRVFMMTVNNKRRPKKKMTEASASVCVLLATALSMEGGVGRGGGEGKSGGLKETVSHSF